MILSVLEFFQPAQGESIVPEILSMFDADCAMSPLTVSNSFGEGLESVTESEALELLSIVLMQSHPFLQSLDTTFLHGLFEKVYLAAARQPDSVDNASLSLCHMVLALGNLLSVAHHRKSGCEGAIWKA